MGFLQDRFLQNYKTEKNAGKLSMIGTANNHFKVKLKVMVQVCSI